MEQHVSFIGSVLISLIEAKIGHIFNLFFCTNMNNTENQMFVPLKHLLNYLIQKLLKKLSKMHICGFGFSYCGNYLWHIEKGNFLHQIDTRVWFRIEKHKNTFPNRTLK